MSLTGYKYKVLTLILVVVALVLITLGQYRLILLIFSLGLTYTYLNPLLSKTIFNSKFYRLIISLFIYSTLLEIIILAAWIFDRNFPLNTTLIISTIFISLIYLWSLSFVKNNKSVKPTSPVSYFKLADIISICIATLILILALGGPAVQSFHKYGHVKIQAVVESYLDTSLDDSNHLSRINDRLQLNRGVLYESNVTKYVVHGDSISTYPPAWHSANAVLIESSYPSIKVGGQSTIAYVITKVFWLFILVFCFTRIIFDLFSIFIKSNEKNKQIYKYVWLVGSITFIAYYTLLEQFQEGFYTFIPLLIALLLAIPLFIQLSNDKKDPSYKPFRVLVPLVLVMTNLTLSWFLIFPALALAIIVTLLSPTLNKSIKLTLIKLWQEIIYQLPILLFVILSILAQIWIITAPGSQTFTEGVNTPGAIVLHSITYYCFTGIGVLLFYILLKIRQNLSEGITYLLICLVGISFFIYIFQTLTIHSAQYYYIKTLGAVMIVAMPMAIIGWLMIIELILKNYSKLLASAFTLALICFLPLAIGINPVNDNLLSYIHGVRPFTLSENLYMYNNLSIRARTSIVNRTSESIYFIPGQISPTIVGTNILRSIQHVSSCDDQTFTQLLNGDSNNIFNVIANCQKVPLTIATNTSSYNEVQNLVKSHDLINKVTVVQIQ